VHRYHFNAARGKAVAAAQNRQLETALSLRSGLFTRSQYLQMQLQMRCLAYLSNDGSGSREIPSPALDILRSFTKQQIIPHILVEPQVQHEILHDRMVRIHAQIAAVASTSSQSAVSMALQSGTTSVSTLVAQDPAIAHFQNTSLVSLTFPPNNKQLGQNPIHLSNTHLRRDCGLLTVSLARCLIPCRCLF